MTRFYQTDNGAFIFDTGDKSLILSPSNTEFRITDDGITYTIIQNNFNYSNLVSILYDEAGTTAYTKTTLLALLDFFLNAPTIDTFNLTDVYNNKVTVGAEALQTFLKNYTISSFQLMGSVANYTSLLALDTTNFKNGYLYNVVSFTGSDGEVKSNVIFGWANGTWINFGNDLISVATDSNPGLMSATDKTKLDSFTLPLSVLNGGTGATNITNARASLGAQATLSGTGIVSSTSGTIAYLTDNSTNWNTSYQISIISAALTPLLLTLTRQNSTSLNATIPTWNQNTTGTASNVTGVVLVENGGTGSSTKNFLDLTTTQTTLGAKAFAKGSIFYGDSGTLPSGVGTYIAEYVSATYGARTLAFDGLAYQPYNIGARIGTTGAVFAISTLADGTTTFGNTITTKSITFSTTNTYTIGAPTLTAATTYSNIISSGTSTDLYVNTASSNGYLQSAGSSRYNWNSAAFSPTLNNTRDLGTSLLTWRNLYLSPTNGLVGVTDGSSASGGYVGQTLEATTTSTVSISSGSQSNVVTLSLTAGDWEVTGLGYITSTAAGAARISISTTSGAIVNDLSDAVVADNSTAYGFSGTTLPKEITVSATTPVYLVVAAYTTGVSATGRVHAKRIR